MASHNHAWLRFFFWVDVSWLFALTQWLGEGEIASREIGDDMYGGKWVVWKILFSDAIFCCSLLTSGVASCTSQSVYTFCVKCQDPFLPILIVYIKKTLFKSKSFWSLVLKWLCLLPNVYCKRTWLWAQICLEDEKSNTLWYQTKYSSQVREDTLTKEDTLPKLKLKPNK